MPIFYFISHLIFLTSGFAFLYAKITRTFLCYFCINWEVNFDPAIADKNDGGRRLSLPQPVINRH
jgi:hypothetical protein